MTTTEITVNPGDTVIVHGAAAQPQPPQPPTTRELYAGYFLTDMAQPSQTVDHCNLQMTNGGDWNTAAGRKAIIDSTLQQVAEARRVGFKNVILDSAFCGFSTSGARKFYRGHVEAQTNLEQFYLALEQANMLDLVTALYAIDEPERNSMVPTEDVTNWTQDLNNAWRNMFPGRAIPKVAIAWGDGQDYRGVDSPWLDWGGIDAYHLGAGVLSSLYPGLISQMRSDQRLIVLPGGADPPDSNRQDPAPFVAYTQNNPKVIWFCPFLWVPYGGHAGIRDNGLAPAYRSAGKTLLGL